MELKITDKEISIGEGNVYALSDLKAFKVWLLMDGKIMAKVQPTRGKPEVFEVSAELTFRDMSDMPIVDPDYFIITWVRGMTAPECAVRSGGKHMKARYEIPKPKRPRRSIFGLHEGYYDHNGMDLKDDD